MDLKISGFTAAILVSWFLTGPLESATPGDGPGDLILRSAPQSGAETVAELSTPEEIQVLQIVAGWAEIRCGNTRGWTEIDDLMEYIVPTGERLPSAANFHFSLSFQAPPSKADSLAGLLDFTFGDPEQERKMTDPSYRHIVQKVTSEWGPLFKYKTPYYSWRGIHLLEIWKEKLFLNLVKGKVNYTDSFGSTWSGEFQDRIIDSNKGILSNRSLFGRGRNVFLELRYSF